MIKSIYLENFKTHLSSTLDFSNGTNLIIGKIGSGKSSIIDGICYALYGTFPSLSNRKLNTSEVIMFKPSKEEKARVVLEFIIDSKIYKVEREIDEKKGTSAKLYLDNKLIAGPKQTEVTDKIEEILQVPYKLFTKIVYSEQNELDYFLKIPPTKRKETFDDLFGIIKLEDVKEGARALDRVIDNEINIINQLSSQIQSQLTSFDYNEKINQKNNILKHQEDLKLNLETEKTKEKSLIAELEIQKTKKKDFDLANNILISRKSKLEDLDKFLLKNLIDPIFEEHSLDQIHQEKEKIIKEQATIKQELTKKTKLLNEKQSFDHELARINSTIKDESQTLVTNQSKLSVKPLPALLDSKKELDEQSSLHKQKRLSLLSNLTELEKSISELKKGFSKCPVCDNPLSKEEIIIKLKEKEDDAVKTKHDLQTINQELSKLKIEEEVLEKQIQAQKENELTTKSITQNLEKNNQRKELIVTEINKLEKEINLILVNDDSLLKLENKLKLIDNTISIIEKKKEQADLKQEVNDLVIKLSKIYYNEEEYIKINSQYINIESNLKSISTQASQNTTLLNNLETQIQNFEKLNKEKVVLEDKSKQYLVKKQDISYFTKSIEISQHQLRKVLIDNINDALDIIWGKVYPYKDYISARLRSENDYILEVQTRTKEWIRVEGLLSGGERACSAISIRIAIALILTKNLGLLILDEPTHNLDTKSIEMLGSVLDEELPGLINQVFIITHDRKLLETLNSHKFIIERDKENDGVSEIKIQ